jgi:integrase
LARHALRRPPRDHLHARALGRSGVRVSELCELRVGHLRLHDPTGARFQIPDAKTEKGIREVEMSPELVEELVMHVDRVRRGGGEVAPEAHVFQNGHGGRMSRHRIGKLVGGAAQQASERLSAQGLAPLPHISPHALRRTYISIALLANNFGVSCMNRGSRTLSRQRWAQPTQ